MSSIDEHLSNVAASLDRLVTMSHAVHGPEAFETEIRSADRQLREARLHLEGQGARPRRDGVT